jgi:hypothetical protein
MISAKDVFSQQQNKFNIKKEQNLNKGIKCEENMLPLRYIMKGITIS